jgi:hypothetical protein
MYHYNDTEAKEMWAKQTTKRWNKKVIFTSRQWVENDGGSKEVATGSLERAMEAYQEYRDNYGY